MQTLTLWSSHWYFLLTSAPDSIEASAACFLHIQNRWRRFGDTLARRIEDEGDRHKDIDGGNDEKVGPFLRDAGIAHPASEDAGKRYAGQNMDEAGDDDQRPRLVRNEHRAIGGRIMGEEKVGIGEDQDRAEDPDTQQAQEKGNEIFPAREAACGPLTPDDKGRRYGMKQPAVQSERQKSGWVDTEVENEIHDDPYAVRHSRLHLRG